MKVCRFHWFAVFLADCPGAMKGAVSQIKALGHKKALIVTDAVLVKVGAVKALTETLDESGIAYAIYDGCEPNPTCGQVEAGLKKIKEEHCDFVISFGGGSPHDCAKAIALTATNGGDIRQMEGVDKSTKPMMTMVAVNTTAGTGAEMTRFCIITDETRHVKMAIVDWRVTPTLAVNDPKTMIGMPKSLTAATGIQQWWFQSFFRSLSDFEDNYTFICIHSYTII